MVGHFLVHGTLSSRGCVGIHGASFLAYAKPCHADQALSFSKEYLMLSTTNPFFSLLALAFPQTLLIFPIHTNGSSTMMMLDSGVADLKCGEISKTVRCGTVFLQHNT